MILMSKRIPICNESRSFPILGGGVDEAKELLKNLIQSECRLVDNNLLHSDRLAAYEAASDLLANMQDTQEEQISKRIKKKFPGNDTRYV